MNIFYRKEQADRFRKRCRLIHILCIVTAVLSLTVCILLCFRVSTLTASPYRTTVILISVLSGWFILSAEVFLAHPAKAMASHIEGVLCEVTRKQEAALLSLGPSVSIPGSVTLRKARFETEEGEVTLNILEGNVPRLPEPGVTVRLQTVRSIVTGWEVFHEEA